MQAAAVGASGAAVTLLGTAFTALQTYAASTHSLPITVALLIVAAFCLLLGCCCGLGWGFVLGLAAPRLSYVLQAVQVFEAGPAEHPVQPRRRLARGRLH